MRRLGGRDYLHLLPPPALPDGRGGGARSPCSRSSCGRRSGRPPTSSPPPPPAPPSPGRRARAGGAGGGAGGGAVECVLAAELRRRAAALPAGDGGAADKTLRRQRRGVADSRRGARGGGGGAAEGGAGGKAAVEAVHEANAAEMAPSTGGTPRNESRARCCGKGRRGGGGARRQLRHAKLEAVAAAVEAASAPAGVDQILLDAVTPRVETGKNSAPPVTTLRVAYCALPLQDANAAPVSVDRLDLCRAQLGLRTPSLRRRSQMPRRVIHQRADCPEQRRARSRRRPRAAICTAGAGDAATARVHAERLAALHRVPRVRSACAAAICATTDRRRNAHHRSCCCYRRAASEAVHRFPRGAGRHGEQHAARHRRGVRVARAGSCRASADAAQAAS